MSKYASQLALTLPGMTPYQLMLTLNPSTFASLVIGDFDGAFSNLEICKNDALGFNRHFVGQFVNFGNVRHLITGREGLVEDMAWALHTLVADSPRKIVFQRDSDCPRP